MAEKKEAAQASEKLQALEAARLQIEKQFGQGSLMKLGTQTDTAKIDVIPSGSILLDEALGIGGYPRGRVIEMYGPESSGKTTLALHAVAESQKLGGIAAFIDAEHALDPVYAKNLGVNIDELWVSQPDTGEQALEICENLVRSGAVDIIVIDSVAALTPQKEIEGEMGDSVMGLQARLMSQALRKLTAIVGKSKCTVIFINQIRMKIGIMFGNPETTTGAGKPRPREGCEEQGGAAFPQGGTGHLFWKGNLQRGKPFGQRRKARNHRQAGRLVHPGRRKGRPRKRERRGLYRKQSRLQAAA